MLKHDHPNLIESISITPNQQLARVPVSLEVPVGTQRVDVLVTMPMASRHESGTSAKAKRDGFEGLQRYWKLGGIRMYNIWSNYSNLTRPISPKLQVD